MDSLAALAVVIACCICLAADARADGPASFALPSGAEMERTEALMAGARELRDRLLADPHRPRYHFMPPFGWLNDPNGPFYWRGRYHLFYQYNPHTAYWQRIQWGHASSTDLVHWTHHPIALEPQPGGPDRDGCFSGMAVIKDGVPTLVYHGVPDGTCLAQPEDDDLIRWRRLPQNPVVRTPAGPAPYAVFDPCAWQHDGAWYLICGWGRAIGRTDVAEGDTAYLFRSRDMLKWEYLHPFFQSERRWTDADEDCAVPCFFPLGGKHVLLCASHKRGCRYYVGRYEDDRFIPERHERLNWDGGHLIAPIAFEDGRGRRLFFGWVNEARPQEMCRESGWAGVLTLPRVLSLGDDGTLRMEPAPELEALRLNPVSRSSRIPLAADSEVPLPDVRGDCLEMDIEMNPASAARVGVKVRCSPLGDEQTLIEYDRHAGTLAVDVSRSTLDPRIRYSRRIMPMTELPEAERYTHQQVAPFRLRRGEMLKLRIFLDRSILEVFANGRQFITQRIYPSRADSLGVALYARGGHAVVRSLKAWEMAAVTNL